MLYPVLLIKRKIVHQKNKKKFISYMDKQFSLLEKKDYLVIYNDDWIGTATSARTLFDNNISMKPIEDVYEVEKLVSNILEYGCETIIFSTFAEGWDQIVRGLKKQNDKIKIKILWHGGFALNVEDYDWLRFKEIFTLYSLDLIDNLGFVKKSMYDFFNKKGYKNISFVMNYIELPDDIPVIEKKKSKNVRIGLYASGERWVKNFYNQLAAISQVKNAVVECIPFNYKVKEFARILNINMIGQESGLPREEMLQRMASNDLNVYVTFTECAPLMPLESFELGVPCVMGNNHHYFENTTLRELVVVEEADNADAISKKIEFVLRNKDEIMKQYKEWKKVYIKEAKKSVTDFIRIK